MSPTAATLRTALQAAQDDLLATSFIHGDVEEPAPKEVYEAAGCIDAALDMLKCGDAYQAFEAVLRAASLTSRVMLHNCGLDALVPLFEDFANQETAADEGLCFTVAESFMGVP